MSEDLAHHYLLALGSNLGDREAMLAQAIAKISTSIGHVQARSDFFDTPPLGVADQRFLNAAIVVSSALPPPAVLRRLLEIEQELGRVRGERWGNRPIDLDILLWQPPGQTTNDPTAKVLSPELCIPHPEMLKRLFVLEPAAQIASSWIHPGTGRNAQRSIGVVKECTHPLDGFELPVS